MYRKAFSFSRSQKFCLSAAACSEGLANLFFLQVCFVFHFAGIEASVHVVRNVHTRVPAIHHGPCSRRFQWLIHRSIHWLFTGLSTSYEAGTCLRSQISRDIWQIIIRSRSEIDQPKVLKEARRYQSVRKLLFPFAGAQACEGNGPSMHIHWSIRVRVTPKVLWVQSSIWRDGEPAMALKWRGRTNQARNKAIWTH